MKTLTICFIIVILSMFGMSNTSEVSKNEARMNDQRQHVYAEKQVVFANETDQDVMNSNSVENNKYIPNEFRFLEEEENDKLLYTMIFDVFFN